MMRPLVGFFLLWLIPFVAHAQEQFVLKDGDRVIFLGNGVIEQEHAFGHLETRLTRRWPKANVVFRNMGWGGDTVQGLARTSGFQQPDGMGRLLNEIKQAKPTVIFVGYGLNESFAGEKGLASFIRDYRKLLEQLDPLKAKLVVLSPTWHEDWVDRPLPDPTQHNKDLEKYCDAIYQIASERKLSYVDLFSALKTARRKKGVQLTTNGIQLSDAGYIEMANAIESSLNIKPTSPQLTIDRTGKLMATGIKIQEAKKLEDGWKVVFQDDVVRLHHVDSMTILIEDLEETERLKGLKFYRIWLDGKNKQAWPRETLAKPGFHITGMEEDFPDGEKLRKAIVKKGELFYRRWRPFNDHSRHWGFIGGDFKLYDDEIAALERMIAELRVPRERTIEIKPAKGGER